MYLLSPTRGEGCRERAGAAARAPGWKGTIHRVDQNERRCVSLLHSRRERLTKLRRRIATFLPLPEQYLRRVYGKVHRRDAETAEAAQRTVLEERLDAHS